MDFLRSLPSNIPFFGPQFLPPLYAVLGKCQTSTVKPESAYLKPVNVVHPFYYPMLAKCPECQSLDVKWDGWMGTGSCKVHGVKWEETALGYQLWCNQCQTFSSGKTHCFATTNLLFWEKKQHWEIPHMSILAGMARAEHIHNVGGIPYFLCHYPFLTLWWKRMMVSVSCALTALIMTSSVLSWKTLSTPFFCFTAPLLWLSTLINLVNLPVVNKNLYAHSMNNDIIRSCLCSEKSHVVQFLHNSRQ